MSCNDTLNGVAAWRARYRRACLPTLILAALAGSAHGATALPSAVSPAATGASPDDVSFDADFFPSGAAPKVDLSRFSRGNVVLPGTYRVDVTFNGTWQARTDIVMRSVGDDANAVPCLEMATLAQWGVDFAAVAASRGDAGPKLPPAGSSCGDLADVVPGATTRFDAGEQVLAIEVPQVFTRRSARGAVDPAQWDRGIEAGVFNYTSNVYRSGSGGRQDTSAYVGVDASMNEGPWQLRHQGALSWNTRVGRHYQSNATYLQHDVPALRAQFTAGDTYTPGALFDSTRLRGLGIGSDERMQPLSQQGFAPVVRGVAESNAHVIVRQRGYIVSDTTVAPGPFTIDDLFATGYGGDLDVEVIEADGRRRTFVVPFSTVAQLLRPGQSRWTAHAGRTQELNLRRQPWLAQGTYQRGLSNSVTVYTGGVLADDYLAVLAGSAFNTGYGAVSVDATQARLRMPGQPTMQGQSLRLGYNRNFSATGTNLALAAYRYSTSGYVGLSDALALRDLAARGLDGQALARERSRLTVNINQALGDGRGQFFVTGAARGYWQRPGRQVDFSAGYSNRYRQLSYSFSAQRTRDTGGFTTGGGFGPGVGQPGPVPPDSIPARRDTRVFLSFSLPLGQGGQVPLLTGLVNRQRGGPGSEQVTVSGLAGPDNRYAYGGTVGRGVNGSTLDVNGQYAGTRGTVMAGYGQGTGFRQASAGASGAIVVHGGGLSLSPPTGDTIGLVYAPDAGGARVDNGRGIRVDDRGYAVVPFLQPYQLNTVTLDPQGIDAGVELESTTRTTAPRAGTVVRLPYATSSGRALMVDTQRADGSPVPFGAEVLAADGTSVGVVGQASRLVLRGALASGELTVRWGDKPAEQCRVTLHVPEASTQRRGAVPILNAPCRQPAPASPASASASASASAVTERYPGIYGATSTKRTPGRST
jgi:outer membrane usher protein